MSDINRIENAIRIAKPQPKKKVDVKATDVQNPEIQLPNSGVNPKSADEVLEYLAQSSAISGKGGVKGKSKKIEVSKYVNPEQAAGIAASVTKFFDGMEKYVGKAMTELNLTQDQAQNLAAMRFNNKFDEEDTSAIIATGERFLVN